MICTISGAFASVITTRAGAAGSEARWEPMLKAGHCRRDKAPPWESLAGGRNRYGAKERATPRNEREKLWPAWQGMARRTPGASLRVNAPFIPITVLPFAQSFTPPVGYPCPETTRAGVTAARPA